MVRESDSPWIRGVTDDSPFSVDFSFVLFWLQFASFSFEPIQRLEVYEMSEVLEHHLDPRHLIGPNNSLNGSNDYPIRIEYFLPWDSYRSVNELKDVS